MAPGDTSYSEAVNDMPLEPPVEEQGETPDVETRLAEVERAVAALRSAIAGGVGGV